MNDASDELAAVQKRIIPFPKKPTEKEHRGIRYYIIRGPTCTGESNLWYYYFNLHDILPILVKSQVHGSAATIEDVEHKAKSRIDRMLSSYNGSYLNEHVKRNT